MLISKPHRFIFVHIQKTAGTSVSAFLEHNCEAVTDGRKHESAAEVRARIEAETWTRFFKFAFVRNPWDRLVSWFHHIQRHGYSNGNNPFFDYLLDVGDTFENFVLHGDKTIETPWGARNLFSNQLDALSADGELIVDFVGRFESLEADLEAILRRLRLPSVQTLQRLNAGEITPDYRDYYSERTRDLVSEKLRRDIEFFDYRF